MSQSFTRPYSRLGYKEIGFVFQFYNLVPSLTAKENIGIADKFSEKQ